MKSSLVISMLNANVFIDVLSKIGGIIVAILILLLMITIHEFGHYTFGKLLKFKINEFAVGFGKAIFKKTNKAGEVISLRIVPLGGYCAFEGEDENLDSKDAFNNQAPWKRLIVLFGGVLFNFISAIIFSIVLLAVVGSGVQQVTSVVGPNESVLQPNDIIWKVDGVTPSFLNGGLAGITSGVEAGQEVTLLIERNGQKQEITIQKHLITITNPETNEEHEVLKFGVDSKLKQYSVGEAFLHAVPFTFEMAWECLVILGKLVTGGLSISSVGGPITTIGVIADASASSPLLLLILIPLIAVNLAVFNLLPIPALDGARIVFVLIEMVRGKPINRELEAKIHAVGLITLFAFVILIDILQILVF